MSLMHIHTLTGTPVQILSQTSSPIHTILSVESLYWRILWQSQTALSSLYTSTLNLPASLHAYQVQHLHPLSISTIVPSSSIHTPLIPSILSCSDGPFIHPPALIVYLGPYRTWGISDILPVTHREPLPVYFFFLPPIPPSLFRTSSPLHAQIKIGLISSFLLV